MSTEEKKRDINALFEQQNDFFGTISRVISSNLKSRLDRLEVSWNEFFNIHKKLIPCKVEYADTIYFSDDQFAVCEEAYLDAKTFLLESLRSLRGSSAASSVRSRQSVAPSVENCSSPQPIQPAAVPSYSRSRQLPQIKLPVFDGSYSNWPQFRDLFFSMVHSNDDISNVEKFHYLKMCLINEPAQLLKNLLVTNDNFQRAWTLLIERYENRRVMVDTQLTLLLSARSLKTESASELKKLLGEVKEALGALESLGCPIKYWDNILVYLIVRKLDSETAKDWEKSISSYRDPSTFEEFEEFLVRRIYTLEAIEKLPGNNKRVTQSFNKNFNFKSHNASVPTSGCSACGAAHYIASCPEYLTRNASQRTDLIISRGLCFNCLGPHLFKKCRVSKRCRFCNKPHHSTLHEAPPEARIFNNKNTNPQSNSPAKQLPSSSHVVHSHHLQTSVLLATALVRIISPRGDSLIVRALIDQGSEVSFVGETLVQQFHLQRRSANVPITGIGSKRTCVTNGVVSVRLVSRLNPIISFEEETLILPQLTSYLPQKRFKHLPIEMSDLPLADPEFTSERKIDLILGVQFYSKIIQNGVLKSKDGLLIAQQTALGWVLSGVLSEQPSNHSSFYGFQCSIDREFLDVMQRFWKQEDDTVNIPRLSSDERECEEHFTQTHSRDSNGRFLVRLPFRKSPNELGTSYSVAVGSFNRMELRFAKNEQLKFEYSKFMSEYLSLGHMRHVSGKLTFPNYYLPHHGVVRETSSTTRLRVVFNGSQPTSTGVSLNDCLHTGPKLQNELIDVLMRWRRHAVAFSCDLEKMYRQIKVHEDDLPFQRIVWREDSSQKLKSYELTTVTYGLSCAPYLAIRCLRQLANEHHSRQPLGAVILIKDTYVDDILSGGNDIDEVQEVIFQLNQVLTAGGFNAHKWNSNRSEALTLLSSDLIAETSTLDIDDGHSPRELGLLWNKVDDQFLFSLNFTRENSVKLTKRSVLSFIARLFDPLGWLSPLIITAKIFM
ncbi:uncharacterized protein [Onthophagus taurus]|uniref:uncharacterized protein n=1 Tax=Onthophagus taurus TaxID=166361 RepID=UPI0039BE213F